MLTCPHCGKPGISAMRKMYLGPAVPATCKTCGKKVGVPYIAMFVGDGTQHEFGLVLLSLWKPVQYV